ncbi:hypothetical protein [Streptosporangium sp. NPDC087985]|uniref:hypothetical protein n=1 Tax=Streptosporangium sp. NPDC087985 TaxID=3366196 RepID=UPI0038289C11
MLIHGGLWEDMDARRFWTVPGITGALRERGLDVHLPDRLRRPESWPAEVAHVERSLPDGPLTVLAGSNGCSLAVRLALAHPDLVARLILAWPATAGDPRVDEHTRAGLTAQGASPAAIEDLLAGQTLRGVTDADLRRLDLPVAVAPSIPNPFHQRHTADALLALVPGTVELLPATPEPPRPEFPAYLNAFISAVTASC